jgi:hypothetical protein
MQEVKYGSRKNKEKIESDIQKAAGVCRLTYKQWDLAPGLTHKINRKKP